LILTYSLTVVLCACVLLAGAPFLLSEMMINDPESKDELRASIRKRSWLTRYVVVHADRGRSSAWSLCCVSLYVYHIGHRSPLLGSRVPSKCSIPTTLSAKGVLVVRRVLFNTSPVAPRDL
jgi:hypothetical protein